MFLLADLHFPHLVVLCTGEHCTYALFLQALFESVRQILNIASISLLQFLHQHFLNHLLPGSFSRFILPTGRIARNTFVQSKLGFSKSVNLFFNRSTSDEADDLNFTGLSDTMGAILGLPISQYPSIAPPSISITGTYPGASAKTVEDAVTQIIEQKMKGIDGLRYMSSTSDATGGVNITLTFRNGTNPDIAQVQVQNKLQLANAQLPQEVQQQGLTVTKSSICTFCPPCTYNILSYTCSCTQR